MNPQKTIEVEFRKKPEYETRLHAASCLLDIGKELQQQSKRFDYRATNIISCLNMVLQICPRKLQQRIRNYIVSKLQNRQRKTLLGGYGYLFQASAVFSAFALNGFLDYCATNPTGNMPETRNKPNGDFMPYREKLAALYRRYCIDSEPNWTEEPFIWFDDCLSRTKNDTVMRDRIAHPLPSHAPNHLKKTYTVDVDVDVQTFLTGKSKFEWEYDDVRAEKLYKAVSGLIEKVVSAAGLPLHFGGFSATARIE